MIRYKGVNHLALATGDMAATIRFWRDLLGMRLVGGLGKPGYRHYFFELGPRDYIAFFEWPGIEPLEEKDHGVPVTGRYAFDHLSMGVQEQDHLWEIKDKLEAAGFWASEVIDHGFIHSLYSFDPNGIAIEFSWDVPGMDLREHPVMADRRPSPEALEGPKPRPGEWPPVERPSGPEDKVVYPGEGGAIRDDGRNAFDRQGPETDS
ncbi:MAG: VOC family protein [Desulfarculaceae bacterium]|nr:VOC family protein [Desulfarculaceae bacterium]MCF8074472.1 VOC family protein [Desulfarculaceae bacterium]MCF8103686.1 VOC family protein [Desulfarculaceae bacterium]MCF8118014.1 VOC family protein [Desulfarculaceae bacterium]